MGEPHITSFNYMVNQGLTEAIKDLNSVEFTLNDRKIKLCITDYSFHKPEVSQEMVLVSNKTIYPTTCRQSADTYKGKFFVDVGWYVDGVQQQSFTKDLGEIPIMVKVRKVKVFLNVMEKSFLTLVMLSLALNSIKNSIFIIFTENILH